MEKCQVGSGVTSELKEEGGKEEELEWIGQAGGRTDGPNLEI